MPAGRVPEFGAEDEIDLAQLWGILWQGKWKIAAFVVAAVIGAVFYLFVVQPTYKADALLQVQPKGSSALSGLSSDLEALTGGQSSPAQSVIPIIKSRSVLGDTVNRLHLNVTAQPQYFPIVGQAIATGRDAGPPAQQPVPPDSGLWLGHYAWGPASLSVTRFEVADALQGLDFTLRALGGGKYLLFGPKGEQILAGRVGEAAEGHTAQGARVALFVAGIRTSAPPTDYLLSRQGWLPVVSALQARLSISEQGDDTGVLRISLEGTDRQKITNIVNSVATRFLRENVEARSQQAEKSLKFLEEQLPELRKELRAAEAKLAKYRQKQETIDLSAEGQALLDRVVAIANQRSQLKLKLAELEQIYTAEHPAVESVREQMQSLQEGLEDLKAKVASLPAAQKQILRLRRNVKVNTELYTALLNRAQELRVIKAGTVGNVRIVDHAVVPVRAVSPKSSLVLALALVLGAMLGCGFVFLQAALRRGVMDPKEIENRLGLPVYAVIPFSRWLARLSSRSARRHLSAPVLARDYTDDSAVEAVRSLRTSLYFAQMDSGSNVILVTGPAPGVGKSFISVNLAYLLAEVKKNVVVVDADMRKGRLHTFFADRGREPGLSQVLTGQSKWQDAVRELDGGHVKILPTGQLPPNPSELLMRAEFGALIEELKAAFDLVIIDAPPILAVTDAAIIGASLPGIVTFLVARAGMHPLGELEEAVNRMDRNDSKIAGVVFNGYQQEHASYGGHGNYYQYEYKPQG